MQKGGYLIISKTDADIYAKCKIALEQGKPILFYEADNTAYYIDTISGGEVTSEIVDDEEVFTYHDIVLTKGGKTITITSSNVVSESGSIQPYKMDEIVDSVGNKRFVEGEGQTTALTGITYTYNKWSLSGSHLMIVLAMEIDNGTAIASNFVFNTITLPKWIYDKLYPIISNRIAFITATAYASDYSIQSFSIRLSKIADTTNVTISTTGGTLTNDRILRIQIDLLVDADYSE